MRKSILSLFSVLALAVGFATPSFAQYQLFVQAPLSARGTVSDVGVPAADGWGFGNPNNIKPPVCGKLEYLVGDTLGQDTTTPVPALAGKIAVLYRGEVNFSQKAYVAQKSGAIGCIIINNERPIVNMAAGDFGNKVLIPTILVNVSWAQDVRPLILNNTIEACLGNPVGLYANNLSLLTNLVAIPQPTNVPSYMVKQIGDFKFPIGGVVINTGNTAQAGCKLVAMVERVSPNPARLWKDSAIIGIIPASGVAGDTSLAGEFFGDFDLVQNTPGVVNRTGQYRVTYVVSQNQVDFILDDNEAKFDFFVNDANAWSRTRLDAAQNYRPIAPSFTTRAADPTSGDQSLKWGQMMTTPALDNPAKPIAITHLTYASNTTLPTLLAGSQISLEVSQWEDLNEDGGFSDDEFTVVGTGSRSYNDENERGFFYTDEILDATTGTLGVTLKPKSKYAILWAYSGGTAINLAVDNLNFNHYITLDTSRNYAGVLNVGTQWFAGFTGFDRTPAFKVTMADLTSVKGVASKAVSLRVFPNPATDRVRVSVSDAVGTGKATVEISDVAGRVLVTEIHSLEGALSTYQISTASLPAGIYNVRVATARGSRVQKLFIAQ